MRLVIYMWLVIHEVTNLFGHFKWVWSAMPRVIQNKSAISQEWAGLLS